MGERAIVAWSGGKECACALQAAVSSGDYEVVALLTTITEDYRRVSMHGVRQELIQAQADALRLKLVRVPVPRNCSNREYDSAMGRALTEWRDRGVTAVVFGDVYLEDVRRYREERLSVLGMTSVFPLWRKETVKLASEFLEEGYRAVVTCVDSHFLQGAFAGRDYDRQFLSELPLDADPCGENGEFHTFVWDGPAFKQGIPCKKGNVVFRDNRFFFCDFMLV